MVHKNLTEAIQVRLSRCQAEIQAAKGREEPDQDKQKKPIISIEEWRLPEPAHVEKVRPAWRAGRYARYQQVIALRQQGMKPQNIPCQPGLSDRIVHRWLAAEAFPKFGNIATGRVLLICLLLMSSNTGKMASEMVWSPGEKSRLKDIPEPIEGEEGLRKQKGIQATFALCGL